MYYINFIQHTSPGLIPLIYSYLDIIGCKDDKLEVIKGYLALISGRATGHITTEATFVRKFVMNHPDYKHDSIISDKICSDLIDKYRLV